MRHSGAQTDGVKDQRAESCLLLWDKSLVIVGLQEAGGFYSACKASFLLLASFNKLVFKSGQVNEVHAAY